MRLDFSFGKSILGLKGGLEQTSYRSSIEDEVGIIETLERPVQKQGFLNWACLPRRRRNSNRAAILLDAPTYEQALELDNANPTRVVRKRVMRNFPKGCPKGTVAEEGCRICLSKFGYRTSELPCGHIYCKGCIDKWLSTQHTCPVCRYEFRDCDTKLIIPE